jgi:hypothetical protein
MVRRFFLIGWRLAIFMLLSLKSKSIEKEDLMHAAIIVISSFLLVPVCHKLLSEEHYQRVMSDGRVMDRDAGMGPIHQVGISADAIQIVSLCPLKGRCVIDEG